MKKAAGKIIGILCLALTVLTLFAGCGSKGTVDITSKWKISEFTVNGTTTKMDDTPFFVRMFAVTKNPKFVCKDGVNCVLTSSGKAHPGTITQEGDTYVITFPDTSKKMYGRISGDKLMIINEGGTLELVFEAK